MLNLSNFEYLLIKNNKKGCDCVPTYDFSGKIVLNNPLSELQAQSLVEELCKRIEEAYHMGTESTRKEVFHIMQKPFSIWMKKHGWIVQTVMSGIALTISVIALIHAIG